MTKKQRKREAWAKVFERINTCSEFAKQYRATNRRIEKRKKKL